MAILATTPFAVAATVEIGYTLESGSAEIEPFSIPNPQGGEDLTIAPSLTIESGGFVAAFSSDSDGIISDGDATISDFDFVGSLDIEASTTVVIIVPISVSATLSGPLSGTQVSGSAGTLVGLTSYIETEIGGYDLQAGPLDCTDSAFGALCGLIEAGLEIEFPLTPLAGEDAPLPFNGGTFQGLNSSRSTAGATISFSIPIDEDTSFGTDVEFAWLESGRELVIPEPGITVLFAMASAIALGRRRR